VSRLSLSLTNACNPLLQAHPPWAQDNTSRGSPYCFPLVFRLAPTHLGWDTQRQFTRRSRDPPGVETPTLPEFGFLLSVFYQALGKVYFVECHSNEIKISATTSFTETKTLGTERHSAKPPLSNVKLSEKRDAQERAVSSRL
jgi:hypothetical protein